MANQNSTVDAVLERRWQRVLRRRDGLLAELERWPTEKLRERPAVGSWSALEVVDHLVRSNREILRMAETARGAQRAMRPKDRVRAWMVLGVMWLPTRVAMPKPVESAVKPQLTGDLPALRGEWERVDATLHDFIAGLTDAERRLGVARHPVSGWLDARAGVRFLESHLAHHCYQIQRIRKALGKRRPEYQG
ncbi:hypothetical protein Acid345_3593 [Candidatus Koribacter versatilis Ellin345]|uniref:DinB-like domain-containing protein n=2 Tax=Candidatus Korobacter versatilis TaxID=658062 RepID=Q1IKK6_KORVE|nr:hypothetical protein Acid345_3593 [Candidatus Koribacter versatilis Ellin345]